MTYNKYIFQKKEKQYISVGTIRMFIEPSAYNSQLKVNPFPATTIARIRCYTMLRTIFCTFNTFVLNVSFSRVIVQFSYDSIGLTRKPYDDIGYPKMSIF